MLTYSIQMPVSDTPIGKWLDRTGAEISISCAFALFIVSVNWKKIRVRTDSDTHEEHWSVTRKDKDFATAVELAVRAAIAKEASE